MSKHLLILVKCYSCMNEVMHKPANRIKTAKTRRFRPSFASLELEQFKQCLLTEHRSATLDSQVQPWLNRVADEAASIAWATPYPLLVLPVLLEEKVKDAQRKAELQKSIYARSQVIVALAE